MKKYLLLFLIAIVYISCKSTPKNDLTNSSDITIADNCEMVGDIDVSEQVDSFDLASNKGRIGGIGFDGENYNDFDYVWKCYYSKLLGKWRIAVNRQELRI